MPPTPMWPRPPRPPPIPLELEPIELAAEEEDDDDEPKNGNAFIDDESPKSCPMPPCPEWVLPA